MTALWRRWLCLVTGHRFVYKHQPLGIFAMLYIGTPDWYEVTALKCERCDLEGTAHVG